MPFGTLIVIASVHYSATQSRASWHSHLLEGDLTSIAGVSIIMLGVAMLVVIVRHIQEVCDVALETFHWACSKGHEKFAIRAAAALATLLVHVIVVAIFCA